MEPEQELRYYKWLAKKNGEIADARKRALDDIHNRLAESHREVFDLQKDTPFTDWWTEGATS